MIEAKKLTKTYVNGAIETRVLRGIDFKVTDGEFVAIMGRSGAGKSTLLYQLSLLDDPTSGDIIVGGTDADHLTPKQKARFRLNEFGYVFQDYALVPELTALENVVLPLLMQGKEWRAAAGEAEAALARMGLGARLKNLPSQLSGGEQQRVSIARAVAHHPSILFADEPTANLDTASSKVVMDIFDELHREQQTIIMVTHEEEYAKRAGRLVTLADGMILSDSRA